MNGRDFQITEINVDFDDALDGNEKPVRSDYVVDEPICTNLLRNKHQLIDRFEYYYENNDYYNENYVKNGLIKSITLSKWPIVGFGFHLDKCSFGLNKTYYFVNDIAGNSPAESCLAVGDLVIELDEFNPADKFDDLKALGDYLRECDTIHLMTLAQVDYEKFETQYDLSLRNYSKNCEDIVIVQWSQLSQE
jgi:hypothetical protein